MERKIKYALTNPELDVQIVEIRRKIRLSMNGVVSEKMAQNGIVYKINYGVAVPRIKEIAADYVSNHDLAQRLWMLQIRETMIMATVLQPLDKFTPLIAQEWVAQFNQIEIIEQTTMNLFSKLSFADSLCLDWIQYDNIWVQITGFILAARIIDKLNQAQITVIIQNALDASSSDEFRLYKAVGLCLSRLCRKDKDTATFILKEIESLSQTTSVGQVYISAEVKQEILFLNIL